MAHRCVCGRSFGTETALATHVSKSVECRRDIGFAASSRAARAADAFSHAEREAGKRTREEVFQDVMRRKLCLSLAKFRYLMRIAGTHVDEFKAVLQNCLNDTMDALRREIKDPAILKNIAPKLQWLDGLETESKELGHLRTLVPVVDPVPRPLSLPQVSTDAEGETPLLPSTSKQRIAYDFKFPELLARLMKHNARAREQIYETLVSWRTKPKMNGKYAEVIVDLTCGRVFLDDPVLGLQARVSEEEARAATLSHSSTEDCFAALG